MRRFFPIWRCVQPKFYWYHLVLSSVTVPFLSDCCWIKEPSHTLKIWWLYRSYQFNVCVWSPISSISLSQVSFLQLSWGVSVSVFIVWSGVKCLVVMLATATNSNPYWLQSLSCSEIVWSRGSYDWESVNYASVVGDVLKCLCESVKVVSGWRSWCKVLECCWLSYFMLAPLSSSSLYRYG